MHDANEIVKAAILNTPVDYWAKVMMEHNPGPEALGSQFIEEQDQASLMAAEWDLYPHPDVMAPAVSYRAEISGKLGVIPLKDLPFDSKVGFQPMRKDGYMEVVVEKHVDDLPTVHFATILIGPGGDNKDIVWTIHPGAPIPPSTFKVSEVLGGADAVSKPIPVADAIKMGFHHAKVKLVK